MRAGEEERSGKGRAERKRTSRVEEEAMSRRERAKRKRKSRVEDEMKSWLSEDENNGDGQSLQLKKAGDMELE